METHKSGTEKQENPKESIGQVIKVDVFHQGIESVSGYQVFQRQEEIANFLPQWWFAGFHIQNTHVAELFGGVGPGLEMKALAAMSACGLLEVNSSSSGISKHTFFHL